MKTLRNVFDRWANPMKAYLILEWIRSVDSTLLDAPVLSRHWVRLTPAGRRTHVVTIDAPVFADVDGGPSNAAISRLGTVSFTT